MITIQSHEHPYINLASNPPLIKGNLLVLDEKDSAVVVWVSQESNECIARTYSEAPDRPYETVRLKEWWAPAQPKVELWVAEDFFGDKTIYREMRVEAILSSSHQPGRLGWTLTYRSTSEAQEQLVATGNDLNTPGVCSFIPYGKFPAGVYTLRATSYHTAGEPFQQAADRIDWTVLEPTSVLSSTYRLLLR